MINSQNTPPVDVPQEVEMAARIFASGLPQFKKLVDNLSLKSAKRLLKAVVVFPLEDEKDLMLVHKEELALFQGALQLMEAKVKMIEFHVSQQQAKEAAKESPEQNAESVTTDSTASSTSS